jgi:hypothetical protein
MKIRTDFKIIYRINPDKPVEIKNVIQYGPIGSDFWFMEFERKIKEKNSNSQFGSSEADYVWIPIKDILKMEATNQEIFDSHNDKETYVKQILTKN